MSTLKKIELIKNKLEELNNSTFKSHYIINKDFHKEPHINAILKAEMLFLEYFPLLFEIQNDISFEKESIELNNLFFDEILTLFAKAMKWKNYSLVDSNFNFRFLNEERNRLILKKVIGLTDLFTNLKLDNNIQKKGSWGSLATFRLFKESIISDGRKFNIQILSQLDYLKLELAEKTSKLKKVYSKSFLKDEISLANKELKKIKKWKFFRSKKTKLLQIKGKNLEINSLVDEEKQLLNKYKLDLEKRIFGLKTLIDLLNNLPNKHLSSENKVASSPITHKPPTIKTPTNEIKKPEPFTSAPIDNNPFVPPITEKPIKPEPLPEAQKELAVKPKDLLFTKYSTPTGYLQEKEWNYPVTLFPKKNCIIRSYREGSYKRRGYKEASFQTSVEKQFGKYFKISGNIRLNTGKDTRPYEPDIAMIDLKSGLNLRIDIEIDEPYAGVSRKPTHLINEDYLRDLYFTERGWIVIRFSELQVHKEEEKCLSYIANIIKEILPGTTLNEFETSNEPTIEEQWDLLQAQKWEKSNYRENYLNHEFKPVDAPIETIERDLNNQEIDEEEKVKPSFLEVPQPESTYNHNIKNKHIRDKRIKFYPKEHYYIVDEVSYQSASTIVAKFFPEFDADAAIDKMGTRHALYGRSPSEIKRIWKEKGEKAAADGTYLHEQIEKFYAEEGFEEPEEFYQFKSFNEDHKNVKPFRTEWQIFDESLLVAGTIDFITKKENGKFDLFDWKRSKKVIDYFSGGPLMHSPWGCGLGQLSHIDDTSYNRYALQQNIYKYILEKNYEMLIENMFLIVFHPENTQYYKVSVPVMEEELNYILDSNQ